MTFMSLYFMVYIYVLTVLVTYSFLSFDQGIFISRFRMPIYAVF